MDIIDTSDEFTQVFEFEVEQKDALENVFEQTLELGNDYLALSKESKNIKDAAYYLTLAERAFNIAIKARNSSIVAKKRVEIRRESQLEIFKELLFPFGEYQKILQPELFKLYTQFCFRIGAEPIAKQSLFRYFKGLGFTQYRADGKDWLLPGNKRRVQRLEMGPVENRIRNIDLKG